MKRLRQIHLYLGCFFAPLITFFATSGVWQTFDFHWGKGGPPPKVVAYLSTVHTGRGLKTAKAGEASTWSSPLMEWLVVMMAFGLVITVVLGILMAFRYGKGGRVWLCLGLGFTVPALLVVAAILS